MNSIKVMRSIAFYRDLSLVQGGEKESKWKCRICNSEHVIVNNKNVLRAFGCKVAPACRGNSPDLMKPTGSYDKDDVTDTVSLIAPPAPAKPKPQAPPPPKQTLIGIAFRKNLSLVRKGRVNSVYQCNGCGDKHWIRNNPESIERHVCKKCLG